VLIAASSWFHVALDQAVSLVCIVFKICLFSSAAWDADAGFRIREAPRALHGGDDPSAVVLRRQHSRDASREARRHQHFVKTNGLSEPAIE
jgi:hypothetical protein